MEFAQVLETAAKVANILSPLVAQKVSPAKGNAVAALAAIYSNSELVAGIMSRDIFPQSAATQGKENRAIARAILSLGKLLPEAEFATCTIGEGDEQQEIVLWKYACDLLEVQTLQEVEKICSTKGRPEKDESKQVAAAEAFLKAGFNAFCNPANLVTNQVNIYDLQTNKTRALTLLWDALGLEDPRPL